MAIQFKQISIGLLVSASIFCTAAQAETQEQLRSSSYSATFTEGYTQSADARNPHTYSTRFGDANGFHYQSKDRPQVWIADLGALVSNDVDGDGFHSEFSLSIDVDTEHGYTDVYAKIYLEADQEPTFLLHETGTFNVYGAAFGDEYRVDSELRNNYLSKYYNVSVDIHDAWSGELLDTATSRGFSNLRELPLESSEFDGSSFANGNSEYNDSDLVVTEYAALFHPALLALLAGVVLVRRRG